MATWRAENSMLTKVGVEILNKIQSGLTSSGITITRIVAGSGRVSESSLYTQTAVSGNTKELVIANKKEVEGGSEISFYITNEGYTESFALNQIGVYVTHPDYEGEQLYFICQCDSAGYDEIPAHSSTSVRLDYSIYLAHGNSDAITITVDPLGAVNKGTFDEFKDEVDTSLGEVIASNTALNNTFNAFKSGLKEGSLITSDAGGNLIASGVKTASATTHSITDAIRHRALSLSIEGASVQATPSITAPTYPTNTQVFDIRSNKKNLFNVQGNMLKKSNATHSTVTITPTSMKVLVDPSSSEVPYFGYLMPITIGKTYTMSYGSLPNNVMSYMQLDRPVSAITTAEHGTTFSSGTKFTATKPFLLVCCHPSTMNTATGFGFIDVQVEEGASATTYAQFEGSVVTLPTTIELASLSGYKDTIEWDGAKWWKVQRIAEVVVDGTTNKIAIKGNLPAAYTHCTVNINSVPITNALINSPVSTSHGNTSNITDNTQTFFGLYSDGNIMLHFLSSAFGLPNNSASSNRTTTLNNWLASQNTAGTPVKVRYVLATPIVTELSVVEVLEMYADLTKVSCSVTGNVPNMVLSYAINTTDSTTMYILNKLARKAEVTTANTFAVATLIE